MNGNDIADGEWQTAPRKRTIKSAAPLKESVRQSNQPKAAGQESTPHFETILRQVDACKASLDTSDYFGFVSHIISQGLPAGEKYDSIVALGIGSLVSPTSQLQLALFLCLCRVLLASEDYASCSIFDPVLTDMDRDLYKHLGIPVLTVNTKGKHTATARTLFFMPHCPYRLYCNVLWANWENLERIHIFGNSFQSYGLRRMHSSRAANHSTDKRPSNRKSKSKESKATGSAAVEPPPVDPADTVALLAPYLQEEDLWPHLPHTLPTPLPAPLRELSEVSSSGETRIVPPPGPAAAVGACRSRFLKEATAVAGLRHLENAVCDMSLMHLRADLPSQAKERLLSLRPPQALIDEAALQDVELF